MGKQLDLHPPFIPVRNETPYNGEELDLLDKRRLLGLPTLNSEDQEFQTWLAGTMRRNLPRKFQIPKRHTLRLWKPILG